MISAQKILSGNLKSVSLTTSSSLEIFSSKSTFQEKVRKTADQLHQPINSWRQKYTSHAVLLLL